MTVDYIGFAYAITVAAGGVIGYVKAGSVPSLGAGLAFGSVLGYGAYQITKDPTNIYLSLGTSVILAGIMGYRYYGSQKFMPAGLITLISWVNGGSLLLYEIILKIIVSDLRSAL